MQYAIDPSLDILSRTPGVLRHLLGGLPESWTHANEGAETWSPFDVLGHLIHGERTDWMERTRIILSDQEERRFRPFDRFAQLEESRGKDMLQLLDEFEALRKRNITKVRELNLSDEQLERMYQAVQAFEDGVNRGETSVEADYQFHLQIALATHNKYFEDFYRHLGTATIPRTRLDTSQFSAEPGQSYLYRTNREHENILDAIARQDPQAASAAMRMHLTNSRERLKKASEASSTAYSNTGLSVCRHTTNIAHHRSPRARRGAGAVDHADSRQ